MRFLTTQRNNRQNVRPDKMQFFNGATLEIVTDKDIDVFVKEGGPNISSLPLCRSFRKDGALWVDCVPALNRKHTAPVPDTAIVSQNNASPDSGRYAVFVEPDTELG